MVAKEKSDWQHRPSFIADGQRDVCWTSPLNTNLHPRDTLEIKDVKQDLKNCIFQVKEALKSSFTIYDVISMMDHTVCSLWKDVFEIVMSETHHSPTIK